MTMQFDRSIYLIVSYLVFFLLLLFSIHSNHHTNTTIADRNFFFNDDTPNENIVQVTNKQDETRYIATSAFNGNEYLLTMLIFP